MREWLAGALMSSSMLWRITQSPPTFGPGLGRGQGRVARGEVHRQDRVEREGELDDAEEEHEEEREDQGELDQRLAAGAAGASAALEDPR